MCKNRGKKGLLATFRKSQEKKQTSTNLKCKTEILSHSPLTDCIHIHTYCGDLATAVLVKFVAARLTSEAVKKKLVTKITVGQLKEGFPYLQKKKEVNMSACLEQAQRWWHVHSLTLSLTEKNRNYILSVLGTLPVQMQYYSNINNIFQDA